jgi:hypothetical protein
MKQKVPAFRKIPENKIFIMLGEGTPFWVFLHFQAQPQLFPSARPQIQEDPQRGFLPLYVITIGCAGGD